MNYYEYIKSRSWKAKSRYLRKKAGKCALCGATWSLVTHHSTYAHLGKEKESDLVVICKDCHFLFHQHYDYDSKWHQFKRKK